jgi:large subunit ribosomal protein L25
MEDIVIELEPREVTGKAVKHLRKEGLVPAVIHDHGKESVVVTGEYMALVKAYSKAGKHHPVNIRAGKQQYVALIRSVDFDPKKHKLRHIVFNAVKANEKVTAEIPVRIKYAEGNEATPAERAGLIVLSQLDSVEVDAVPSKLPELLEFDGEKLVAVGDHATVADLIAPEGVTIKTDLDHPLATVFEPAALQAANEATAGGAEDTDATEAETEAAEGEAAEAGEGDAKAEEKKD